MANSNIVSRLSVRKEWHRILVINEGGCKAAFFIVRYLKNNV